MERQTLSGLEHPCYDRYVDVEEGRREVTSVMGDSMEDSTRLEEGVPKPSSWLHKDTVSGAPTSWRNSQLLRNLLVGLATCVGLYVSYTMLARRILMMCLMGGARGAALGKQNTQGDCSTSTSSVPQYFQTSHELWAGPTATGEAPFLAQTNPVSFAPTVTFVPNTPLETGEPIIGQAQNESIFRLMANLSPYFPNPIGFGVAEYPLAPGASIFQVQVGFSI